MCTLPARRGTGRSAEISGWCEDEQHAGRTSARVCEAVGTVVGEDEGVARRNPVCFPVHGQRDLAFQDEAELLAGTVLQ